MPPSVFTPLCPLHCNTCGEGKGALPRLFYATAAESGHVQLHMNPTYVAVGYTHMLQSPGGGLVLGPSAGGRVHAGVRATLHASRF